jgi:hypothetical protein
MTKGNDTCKKGSEDIFNKEHPRAFHLQIVISATLGIGAFLTFCVRLRSLVFLPAC